MAITDPTDISDLICWLDADAETSFTDGDPMAQWTDQSGTGNHATQTTASRKPTWTEVDQNGLSVVSFDGTQSFDAPAIFAMEGGTTFAVGYTEWPTAGGTGNTSIRTMWDAHLSAAFDTEQGRLWRNSLKGINAVTDRVEWEKQIGPSELEDNGDQLQAETERTFYYDQGFIAHMLRTDGTDGDETMSCQRLKDMNKSCAFTGTATTAYIGRTRGSNNFQWKGTMGEFIHYDAGLSDSDMQDVLDYLVIKWNIACGWNIGSVTFR